MESKEVTIFGATGLIGNSLLDIIIKDNYYHKVNIVTRKAISITHKKIKNHAIFGNHNK